MSDVMKKERGQFGRWLRGGLLSGRPKQTVSGITDIIFFLAFTFCFSWEFINTTMFKKLFSDDFELRMEGWYNIAVIAAFACGVAALLLQDSVRQALFEALILTAGYLHWKVGGGKYSFFVFCVLIVGMTGRSFKALLVIACSIGTAMTAAAFAASQLGVIEDLVYTGGRHSFGIVYCTDCASHILFLLIMYAMLRLEELTLIEYVVMILCCGIMMMTKCKTDVYCCILLLAGVLVYKFTVKWHQSKAVKIISGLMAFSYIICAVFSFVMTFAIDPTDQKTLDTMDRTLVYRVILNRQALGISPFSIFGTAIDEHGFGGRTKNLPSYDEYFFIDSSYIRLYVIGGVALFCLILLTMTYAQIRCYAYKNYGFIFLLSLAALACFMEHHLMELPYNIFPMIAFAGKGFLRAGPRKKTLPWGFGAAREEETVGPAITPDPEVKESEESSAPSASDAGRRAHARDNDFTLETAPADKSAGFSGYGFRAAPSLIEETDEKGQSPER